MKVTLWNLLVLLFIAGRLDGAISVKDYGAKGDGTVDEIPAFNAAKAAARAANETVIVVPGGTYRFDSTFMIDRASGAAPIGLIGQGGATLTTNADIPLITVDTSGGRMDGVHIEHFDLINTNNSATNDCGILFTEATPTGNFFNTGVVNDLHGHGLTCLIRNTRSIATQEAGMNWCLFTNLSNWNDGLKIPSYVIRFDYGGGGTGNQMSVMSGNVSVSFIEMGNGGTQNVGDWLISDLHMSGTNTGSVNGIKLTGGASYGHTVTIENCQWDAGINHGLNFTGMHNFHVRNNNWGGNTDAVLTNCSNGDIEADERPVTLTNSSDITITDFGRHRSLTAKTAALGEKVNYPQQNEQRIGTVAKNVAPSGNQGTLLFSSSDASNPLVAYLSLITDPTGSNRRFSIGALEQNVAWRTLALAEPGGGVTVGPVITSPGDGNLAVSGQYLFATTVTAAGATGNRTINKQAGTVRFAPGVQALILTNNLVATSTKGLATVQTDDISASSCKFIASNGSATLKLNAPATAETEVYWEIRN